MNFFRKYFVHLVLLFVGLAMIAFIARYFIADESERNVRPQEIETVTIDFTKEAELQIHRGEQVLKTLEIEFADTPSERELGLMYRSSMAENQGMLFIYPYEEEQSFYMKNTEISLDIIYINKNKEIVSVAKNAKPFDETSLPSGAPAQYVLEVNGGKFDAWGLQIGDTITYE